MNDFEIYQANASWGADRRSPDKILIDARLLRKLIVAGNCLDEFCVNADAGKAWTMIVKLVRESI